MLGHIGLHGEAPRMVRRQGKRRENVGRRLFCGFFGKKQVR